MEVRRTFPLVVRLLSPVVSVFATVARLVGTWMSHIILGTIFLVVVVPYGYLYRAVEKALAKHFFDSTGRTSFYAEERKEYGPRHFEKPW